MNATSGLVERITMDAIGKQYNIATIGEGSSELVLSNVRGEIDIVASPYDNLIGYAQNDDVTPLWVYNDERYPDLPDTPTIGEIGFPELTNTGTIARIIVAPPGTPEEILTILREAFDKAIAEPDVKDTLPMSGDYKLAEDLVKAAFIQVEPLKEDLINYEIRVIL